MEYEGLILQRDLKLLPKQYDSKNTVYHQILHSRNELPHSLGKICLYFPFHDEIQFKYEEQTYLAKIKRSNSPGLHRLSFLLNEAIKGVLNQHPLVLADEFQLEANLNQFDIEVNSIFLKKRLNEVPSASQENLQELNRLLAVQLVILNQIEENFEEILPLQPQFSTIHERIRAFQELLTDHLVNSNYGLQALFRFERLMQLTSVLIGSEEKLNTRTFIALWLAMKRFKRKAKRPEDPEFAMAFNQCYRQTFDQDPPSLPINLF